VTVGVGDDIKVKTWTVPLLDIAVHKSGSQHSPAAQDFLASGGLEQNEEIAKEVQVPVQSAARIPVMFPDRPESVESPKGKVISLSPFSGSAFLSSLDLNLDQILPPYLSLSTAIDILKLIRDDDNVIQGASKSLLLECLETLDHSDDPEQQVNAPVPPPMALDQQKKRARKASDPMDTTSIVAALD
jgi:hypothetical protein